MPKVSFKLGKFQKDWEERPDFKGWLKEKSGDMAYGVLQAMPTHNPASSGRYKKTCHNPETQSQFERLIPPKTGSKVLHT